jgi:hypothetical protein
LGLLHTDGEASITLAVWLMNARDVNMRVVHVLGGLT